MHEQLQKQLEESFSVLGDPLELDLGTLEM